MLQSFDTDLWKGFWRILIMLLWFFMSWLPENGRFFGSFNLSLFDCLLFVPSQLVHNKLIYLGTLDISNLNFFSHRPPWSQVTAIQIYLWFKKVFYELDSKPDGYDIRYKLKKKLGHCCRLHQFNFVLLMRWSNKHVIQIGWLIAEISSFTFL